MGKAMTTITDRPAAQGGVSRTYSVDGECGGFSVRRSPGGWIVETWSRTIGCVTCRRVLVPMGIPAPVGDVVRHGVDPEVPINGAGTTYAEWLLHVSGDSSVCRVLRRGVIVQ